MSRPDITYYDFKRISKHRLYFAFFKISMFLWIARLNELINDFLKLENLFFTKKRNGKKYVNSMLNFIYEC